MLRIEVSIINGSSYDRTRFERQLRREILRVVAEVADSKSVDIARIQFIKPKR